MKPVFILFFFCIKLNAQSDPVKKNTFFVHVILSNLLVGDIPLGFEHLYKKRISHEFQASVKCFNPLIFKYSKGFRLNYQIKYSVINKDYFRMSLNATTSFKEASFTQKESYWSENKTITTDLMPKYIMDREFKQFGIGCGIGLNFKLTTHLFIGSEILLEICKTKKAYRVKEQQIIFTNSYMPLAEPYHYEENTYSGFSYKNFVANFKVAYSL